MTEHLIDFTGFPEFPSYQADWVAVYMEPIVQSGERLTIGVVATDGVSVGGQLAISEKALQCLYGEAAGGMRAMMEMALQRALTFARSGFDGVFSSGMHGVSVSKRRQGIGESLEDIIQQGVSLTSSLSDLHGDEDTLSGFDRTSYWQRLRAAMTKLNPALSRNFGQQVEVNIRGSSISIPCDYFSSKLAVNICGISPGSRLGNLFDVASSRITKLEQLRKHDALIRHDHKASLLLVTPSDIQIGSLKPAAFKSFSEKMLILQDMAEEREFNLISVPSARDGAKALEGLERDAA